MSVNLETNTARRYGWAGNAWQAAVAQRVAFVVQQVSLEMAGQPADEIAGVLGVRLRRMGVNLTPREVGQHADHIASIKGSGG